MTLSELAGLVKRTVESISGDLWVVAELAEVNVNKYSGHCYMGLVEKKDETIVAQMRANIWAGVYKRLISVFTKATGTGLKQGMKVLMRGTLNFHEVYGLSLNVREIDPQYTLGEMALKRRETLERLKKKGVIDLNRALVLPIVPQRIAVIASETSAGYGDFLHRMTGNPYGYAYRIGLFPSIMQGDRAEDSIIKAIKAASRKAAEFDVVVLIRGGGSQVDLSCFDSYALALEVACCPLPVLSGIGHERDETVTDRVSNKRLITPSAVAEFLVVRAREFEERFEGLRQRLVVNASDMLGFERHRLAISARGLVSATRGLISELRHRLSLSASGFSSAVRKSLVNASEDINRLSGAMRGGLRLVFSVALRTISEISSRLKRAPMISIERTGRRLETLEAKARLLDPASVLRRGYSITTLEGKALRSASSAGKGDRIRTRLYDGEITSIIEDIKKEERDA
jgi:exodeoxyribonuclease VII large subunit